VFAEDNEVARCFEFGQNAGDDSVGALILELINEWVDVIIVEVKGLKPRRALKWNQNSVVLILRRNQKSLWRHFY
jgi:hypothetical protein